METELLAQIKAINLAISYTNELASTQSTEVMNAPPAMLMQIPQLANTLTIHAISTSTFEGLTPVFLALAKMGTNEPVDYGVVGAEADAVGQLQSLLNQFLENT